MVGINKVEINEEHEEKFEDGIISPLTEKSYVVFCRDEGPHVILDNIKGYYIPRYNTGENSVSEIVEGLDWPYKKSKKNRISEWFNDKLKKADLEGARREA